MSRDPETLERLRRTDGDPSRRILLRGGTVLTMDDAAGDLARGDVLIEGDRIVAVAPALGAAAADVVIAAEGTIVLPGLQDTHRHCWQGQFRRLLSGCDLSGYAAVTHFGIAPLYRPEDVYAGSMLSAAGALDSGVTTLLDFAHNTRTPEHSDAGLQAFREVGIRGIHVSGPPMTGEWERHWPADLTRLASAVEGDALLGLRVGLFGADEVQGAYCALSPETLANARGLGLTVSVDGVFGPLASANLERLGTAGLLGPDITLIHCNDLSDDAWRYIADAGVTVSLCPTSDTQIGIYDALPPIQRALDFGVRFGLSVDVECSLSSDMFTQMQSIYTTQRMLAYHARHRGEGTAEPVGVRDVLRYATVDGAHVNGVGPVAGTLAPGMAADVVLLAAEDLNTMPLNNAAATAVLGADTSNVDTVFVAGRVRKWGGERDAADVARLRRIVHASRDHLVERSGYPLDVVARRPVVDWPARAKTEWALDRSRAAS